MQTTTIRQLIAVVGPAHSVPDSALWASGELLDGAQVTTDEAELLGMPSDSITDLVVPDLLHRVEVGRAYELLTGWLRVLAPGGSVMIKVPDWENCAVTAVHDPARAFVTLFSGVDHRPVKWGWTATTLSAALHAVGYTSVDVRRLGLHLHVQARRPGTPIHSALSIELATQAPFRLLAWPKYDDTAEMDHLFSVYGGAIANRPTSCLVLRHDMLVDGPLDLAQAAVEAAFERNLAPEDELEVLFIDDPSHTLNPFAVEQAVTAVLRLPSSASGERAQLVHGTGRPVLADGQVLALTLEQLTETILATV